MRIRLAAASGVVALACGAGEARTQERNVETCRNVHAAVFEPFPEGPACQALAGRLVLALTDAFWVEARGDVEVVDVVGPGDLQPANGGASTAAGSVGQGEAMPSGHPLGLGGGSVAAVGSDAGSGAVTSLSVNPLTLFRDGLERFARDSRTADLTVFFPVDDLDRDDDGSIDYVGLRLRVNVTGASAGARVWEAARQRFEALLAAETRAAAALRHRFGSMAEEEMEGCARAIVDGMGPEGVARACGPGIVTPAPEEYEAFRRSLDEVRVEADARYLGLDLRMDLGDPTLGAVEDAEATAVTAGLAYGRRLGGPPVDPLAPSAGVRARLGVRWAHLRALDATSAAADGGVAVVVRRPVTVEQGLTLSGGLEFRFGDDPEALEGPLQSDHLTLRASLSVPVTPQAAVTLGFAHPLMGDQIPQAFTVTGDWQVLLPGLLGG